MRKSSMRKRTMRKKSNKKQKVNKKGGQGNNMTEEQRAEKLLDRYEEEKDNEELAALADKMNKEDERRKERIARIAQKIREGREKQLLDKLNRQEWTLDD